MQLINLGTNANTVKHGNVSFHFSYETMVGVEYSKGLFVRENSWGSATGKHLNHLDGGHKKSRLEKVDFTPHVEAAIAEMNSNA